MAASMRHSLFSKLLSFSRSSYCLQNLTPVCLARCVIRSTSSGSLIHTSAARRDLMEFFDDPKNFGATAVKSGRSWTLDELRIKSNPDLHKLWFVLLKERNMLMTMEHNCLEGMRMFPSPERLDRVRDSMDNLEQVIRERNEAYWKLEVGEEAPKGKQERVLDPKDPLALVREAAEAVIEAEGPESYEARKFVRLLKEKERRELRKMARREERAVLAILKRFPNCDKEALQQKYPDVDVSKLIGHKKTLGMHEFNLA